MNETGIHEERLARQFTELFTANYGPVLAYAQRRVGAGLAQDVVADTFLAAWRNIRELPPDPLPWLYRAAHFAVANQRRTLARRGRLDDRARLQASSAVALDHSDRVAADLELAAAFRALSEADREVLRLAAWERLGPPRSAWWSAARRSRPRRACIAPASACPEDSGPPGRSGNFRHWPRGPRSRGLGYEGSG